MATYTCTLILKRTIFEGPLFGSRFFNFQLLHRPENFSNMRHMQLCSGQQMPILGLGTWKSKAGEVENAVRTAIDVGYRHIDCAFIYGNENEVGAGIKDKLAEGKITREDLFIVSKLWNTHHMPEDVLPSLEESLRRLGLEYIDLYLMHWPHALKPGKELFPKDEQGNILYADIDYLSTWKAMEECVDKGLIKSIGLSNFNSEQVQRIVDEGRIKPAVNQVEIHPYFSQEKLVKFCQERGVAVTAYSPLASADRPWAPAGEPLLVDDPKIKEVAQKNSKTSAQVILRWLIQRDIIVIPKSVNAGRIKENFEVFDFELSSEDMETINSFNRDERLVVPKITVDGKQILRDRAAPHFPFNIEF